MCGHANITFFCPEGRKKPEPISEVHCRVRGCKHHWLLIGACESPTIRDKMELRREIQGLLRTPKPKIEHPSSFGNTKWEVCGVLSGSWFGHD